MNRIAQTFARLKSKGEKALVGFVTAGDPDMERSFDIIKAMCAAGCDILELGVPFSDPTADGPVIQKASGRSLAAGTNLAGVMALCEKVRAVTEIPIILFSYYNPILAYGPRAFHEAARKAGADGVLAVDLPPEEAAELTACGAEAPLPMIRLIAPTTPVARMSQIAAAADGFLYLVSKTGVTGSDGLDISDVSLHLRQLKSVTDLPVCVGFGISTPEDVSTIARQADGVVIGSAFERIIEANRDAPDLPGLIAAYVRDLKAATRT